MKFVLVIRLTGDDPKLYRCGCFLSDLTGFTVAPPATSLEDYGIIGPRLQ
jgi:hypothetical protein